MSLIYTVPTNVELDVIQQEFQANPGNFIGIREVAPIRNFGSYFVEWDQLDDDWGMTSPHVLGTDPKIQPRPGSALRRYDPGNFKQSEMIDEGEILRQRQLGTFGNVVDLSSVIARRQRAGNTKTFIRMEWCVWRMLEGRLVINENGVAIDESFPTQKFLTKVPWSDHQNATPLQDLMDCALKFPGTGATGAGAPVYLNQVDLNDVLANKNENDLWGYRGKNFLALTYSIEEVNKILSDRNLPVLRLYDELYKDANKVVQRFIANGKPCIVGRRQPGEVIANFASVISLHRTQNGMPAPGMFSFLNINDGPNNGSVSVSVDALGQSANPNIKLTYGVYGGPLAWYPRSIISMDVTHTGS